MTSVLLTIDTELSPSAHRRGLNAEENFGCAILGRVSNGQWGTEFQIARFNEYALKAVFFVEALSPTVVGLDFLKRTVNPILSAGHEVQLHIHTEWLEWFTKSPIDDRRGQNIADFSLADQQKLIQIGIENLERAGAPRPVAFRAGNYGANNDTLLALASEGILYDSSYNFPYLGHPCRIAASPQPHDSVRLDGTIEIPVSTFADFPGHQRPAQLCAISTSEMQHMLEQCVEQDRRHAVIVSHSFELLNGARNRSNPIVVQRFKRLCEILATMRDQLKTTGFHELDQRMTAPSAARLLRSASWRTGLRVIEQAAGTVLFG